MATNFPTGLDDFANYVDGDTIFEAALLNDMQFAIEALQAKVGITNSVVTASHDYKIDHKEDSLVAQAAASIFGARTAKDTAAGTLVKTSIYKAQSDGILTVFITNSTDWFRIISDSASTPTVLIAQGTGQTTGIKYDCITAPIIKDDYVQITSQGMGVLTIFWVPIGTGGLVKQ